MSCQIVLFQIDRIGLRCGFIRADRILASVGVSLVISNEAECRLKKWPVLVGPNLRNGEKHWGPKVSKAVPFIAEESFFSPCWVV